MQTFLPLATTDFSAIAKTLDNKRLNKQALEGWQILMTLVELDPAGNHRNPKGWVNHPAVKMWRGHESALLDYINAMVVEWEIRGFKSTISEKAIATHYRAIELGRITTHTLPQWIVDNNLFEQIAVTHRQALLVKEYPWYSQFEWPEDSGAAPTEYQYLWPV